MKTRTKEGAMRTMGRTMLRNLGLTLALLFTLGGSAFAAEAVTPELAAKAERVRNEMAQRTSNEERQAAADALKALREKVNTYYQIYNDPTKRTKGSATVGTLGVSGIDYQAVPIGPFDAMGNPNVPDYNTTANWAYSPPLTKFVDTLPGVGPTNQNNLNNYISVAVPDITSYPGSDYYEIDLVQYNSRMHSDLPAPGTLLRGYVQANLASDGTATCGGKTGVACPTDYVVPPQYLGATIVAQRDRPVRVKFTNKLGIGTDGDLFLPVDQSVMGAGTGPLTAGGAPCDNTVEGNTCEFYTQNRATIHLHGGRTPWISDGTPHQWITPANETTPYPQGVSVANVPDMEDPGDGSMTFYYSNQQTARLMFYHDHAFGITRINVYAGMAAGYLIQDEYEQDLVARSIIPADIIPLVIQDKTFVDASEIRKYDPLWNWGSGAVDVAGVRAPVEGDLWLPHVYMPAQNPYNPDLSGVNPFGRWMYGPWFYPPTVITHPPMANPYHDPDCDSTNPAILAACTTPGQPPLIPATPHPSMGMEAFADTAVVNGTAFPTLVVEPRAYRFRILNAANDRGFNLSFYKADPTPAPADARRLSNLTEVKMVDAAVTPGWPELWPTDGRVEGVPDPGTLLPNGRYSNWGPSFIQIGTDAGFLPKPAIREPQPITFVTDPTAFWVGVVKDTALGLMPAERADVVVDFCEYAGQTLILYNDGPAAWPAAVWNYDYYTGAPDRRDSGGYGAGGTFNAVTGVYDGGAGILPGYGPNTRTVMQVVVNAGACTPYSVPALEAEFTAAAAPTPLNPTSQPLFERAMEPVIVGQDYYNSAYNLPGFTFPSTGPYRGTRTAMTDRFVNFVTVDGQQVTLPLEPKAIHDEMGASFDPEYGRMSGNLGTEISPPLTNNANMNIYGFSDIPTEVVNNSEGATIQFTPLGQLADGTQLWNVSHNGVDTHPIHFHIFDVQLINRMGWDGQLALPEPNEYGWKDTIRISPLMDTIVAVRPVAPLLPFGIANSMRPLNPAIPIGSGMNFNSVDPITGQVRLTGLVTNVLYNFGWEYVWHCHILSHEEMDMMRPIVLDVVTAAVADFTAPAPGTAAVGVDITWTDPTPVDYLLYPDYLTGSPGSFGNIQNEVGFNIWRSTAGGVFTKVGSALANQTTFNDQTGAVTDDYVIEAFNASGSTFSMTPGDVTLNIAGVLASPADLTLTATITAPLGQSITKVDYYNGTILIGTGTTGPDFSFNWTGVGSGTYNVTAVATAELLDAASLPVTLTKESLTQAITVDNSMLVNFSANGGAPIGPCEVITLTSAITGISTPPYTYAYTVDGQVQGTLDPATGTLTLPAIAGGRTAGVHDVTLTVTDSTVPAQVTTATGTFTIDNQLPTFAGGISAGGPYTINFGETITLTGSIGTDPDLCNTLTYSWDINNDLVYDYTSTTNLRSLSYSVVQPWLVTAGDHTINYAVTDSSGGVVTAFTTLTVGALPILDPPASITVPATNVTGSYPVSWAPALTAPVGVTYTLEESTDNFATYPANSRVVTSGLTATSAAITGKTNGTYTYRVKAVLLPMTDSTWVYGTCVVSGPVSSVIFTASQPSPQVVGALVDFIATPTGGAASIEYQLWAFDYNGVTPTWRLMRDWQTSPTLNWDTSLASGAGQYNIQIRARNVGSLAVYEARAFNAYYYLINNAPVSAVSFTAIQASPQGVGALVDFIATPTGGGASIEYQLWVYDYNGITPTWRLMRDWQTSPTLNWDTSLASGAGQYNIQVRARNVGSSVVYEARALNFMYSLTTVTPVSAVTFTANPASPQVVGTLVDFIATPTGGGASIEYQLWVYDYNGVTPTWRLMRDWQVSPILNWNTSLASGAGQYNIQVRARNVGSTAVLEARALNFMYTLN